MRHAQHVLVSLALVLVTACAANTPRAITQVGTIDALLAGQYDGVYSLESLAGSGTMGIGTFDQLNGEMVMLDGRMYQVLATGEVVRPAMDSTTPFAAICFFDPENALSADGAGLDYDSLKHVVDGLVPSQNAPLAIIVRGEFTHVHTRSVPAQTEPYPPLAEVTKNQPEFHAESIKGVLVGFRLPPFVKGINVTGYHLHFISNDRQFGGHVLDFAMVSGQVDALIQESLVLKLPVHQASFLETDQSLDRSRELEAVEN